LCFRAAAAHTRSARQRHVVFEVDPLKNLRGDPRYLALISKMKLAD
jgi:hypothetical protein